MGFSRFNGQVGNPSCNGLSEKDFRATPHLKCNEKGTLYMEMQTDPLLLWSTQTERRKQWISIQGTFILAVLAAPVVLAITRQEPTQLLKLGYPVIALFLAVTANHIGSAASFLSAFISLAIFLLVFSITLPIVQWITSMSPSPDWYIAVIPLSVFLDAMNATIIPAKERMEWKSVKANTGLDDKALLATLINVNLSNQYARKTYINVFETKAQTFWEKLGRTKNKRKDATRSGHLSTSTSENKSRDKTTSQQMKARRESPEYQPTSDFNELHELQRQAEESMKRFQHDFKESATGTMSTSAISGATSIVSIGTKLAKEYQDAFFRNDRTALMRMSLVELNITQESEDDLLKNGSSPTQFEVVKAGGSYYLIQSDQRHWLVPSFQILSHLNTTTSKKGIFNYSPESIACAELRRPAEVRAVGDVWEVVRLGVIAVPA